MPFYDYKCNDCNAEFKKTLKIADRNIPETEPCPSCNKEGVVFMKIGAPVLSDSIRMGLKKNDGGFKEVIQKIHNGVSGSTLDKSRILS